MENDILLHLLCSIAFRCRLIELFFTFSLFNTLQLASQVINFYRDWHWIQLQFHLMHLSSLCVGAGWVTFSLGKIYRTWWKYKKCNHLMTILKDSIWWSHSINLRFKCFSFYAIDWQFSFLLKFSFLLNSQRQVGIQWS